MHQWCRRGLLTIVALMAPSALASQEPLDIAPVNESYPEPADPFAVARDELPYDDNLAAALAEAYAKNPELAAQRYELRAIDDEIGVALSGARPNIQAQVSSGYEYILPGDITQASRTLSDQINDPNIEQNDIATQFVIDQPLWTGGRVSSSVRAATAASRRGFETLRRDEGDLLLDVIIAYSDVRRDSATVGIRQQNVASLAATLDEIIARRGAGELTRTDIAQGEVQLQSARVQLSVAQAQLQASRAAFAALVGRAPGELAPEPQLPGLPAVLDDAFVMAGQYNPELAAAIAAEKESRARIAVVKSEGAPRVDARGTAGTNGPVSHFDRRDQDITFAARATVTIPLSAGGRIRSQIAQAQNRNTADELRIEATRRQLVRAIIGAWNQWASAEQSILAQQAQMKSALVFYEGTKLEYREGLRSTFDVLFALNSVRDAQIALLASQRDSYVAQAALLRRIGLLEAEALLDDAQIYDPSKYQHRVRNRNAVPWGGIIRSVDRIGAPEERKIEHVDLPASDTTVLVQPGAVTPPKEISSQVIGGTDAPEASVIETPLAEVGRND